jgi:hypothetical protein
MLFWGCFIPSKSISQQHLFGAVHACQKTGKCDSEKIRDMASKIKPKDVTDFASTKHKGLPDKVKKEKSMKENTFKKFSQYLAEADGIAQPTDNAGLSRNVTARQDRATDASENLPFNKKITSIARYLVGMNLDPNKINNTLFRIKKLYLGMVEGQQAQQQQAQPQAQPEQ